MEFAKKTALELLDCGDSIAASDDGATTLQTRNFEDAHWNFWSSVLALSLCPTARTFQSPSHADARSPLSPLLLEPLHPPSMLTTAE
eukprot:2066785-Prymnesium_polylepis.2